MIIQLGWSLISATILCLKPFVATLGSGYLGATLNANLGSYANSGGCSAFREESYVLNQIGISRQQDATVTSDQERDRHSRRDIASIGSANRTSDDGSQELIIQRTAEYKINYEDDGDHRQDKKPVA